MSMHLTIRLLIAFQLLAWVVYMVVAYMAPDEELPDQSLEGFLFLCGVAIILCFFPALRMARSYAAQPFALVLSCLPIIAVGTVTVVRWL
ncbi:hypothetical protein [Cognatishimia activa]|nr:hypothetical protein [Cognatishimia activa]